MYPTSSGTVMCLAQGLVNSNEMAEQNNNNKSRCLNKTPNDSFMDCLEQQPLLTSTPQTHIYHRSISLAATIGQGMGSATGTGTTTTEKRRQIKILVKAR